MGRARAASQPWGPRSGHGGAVTGRGLQPGRQAPGLGGGRPDGAPVGRGRPGTPLGTPREGHGGRWCMGVAWSPDGGMLASAGGTTIRLWDAWPPRSARTCSASPSGAHGRTVTAVAFGPDGQRLASAGGGRDGAPVGRGGRWPAGGPAPRAPRGRGAGAGVEPGRQDAGLRRGADRDGAPVGRGRPAGRWARPSPATPAPCARWRGARTGKTLASPGADGTVRLWDAAEAGPSGEPLRPRGAVLGVAWSPDGQTLASGGGGRDGAPVGRGRSPAPGRSLAGHTGAVLRRGVEPGRHDPGHGRGGRDGAPVGRGRPGRPW